MEETNERTNRRKTYSRVSCVFLLLNGIRGMVGVELNPFVYLGTRLGWIGGGFTAMQR